MTELMIELMMQVAEQRIKDLECVLQLDSTMYDHLKLVEAENSELKETVVRQNRCLVNSSNFEMILWQSIWALRCSL